MQDFAKLPWQVDMPADKAAAVLGSYLGVTRLEPAAVLDLDIDQITGALHLPSHRSRIALFSEQLLLPPARAVPHLPWAY